MFLDRDFDEVGRIVSSASVLWQNVVGVGDGHVVCLVELVLP